MTEKILAQQQEINDLKSEKERLKSQIQDVRNQNYKLQKKLCRKEAQAKKQESSPLNKACQLRILQKHLSPFFTPKQIKCFFKGKWTRVKNWSVDDVKQALTLRLMSKKAYIYLRKKKTLPLPGISTLRSYFKNFRLNQGFFTKVGEILSMMSEKLFPIQRVVTLMFDEVHVKKAISYNAQLDQIVGPHSAANTAMIRGIFHDFQMPVWSKFDYPSIPKEEFLALIVNVEELGYHVLVVTCDMGGGNPKLAKELGVTEENPWFENPYRPGKKIFWMFDSPHLIKLIRNNVLNYTFVLNGQLDKGEAQHKPIGTQSMFANVYEKVHNISGEITSAYKLRDHRLYDVKGLDKQRVKPAVQLLSKTMAQTIRILFPNDENMLNLAQWIEETNDWFDCMNSLHDNHINEMKCPFEAHYEKQMQALKTYQETTRNLKILWGRDSLMPWQQGKYITEK